ncbi:hypothetical protein OS493_003528 [Desmophyllum pertusum]|uniref:MAM domain-containing protein n=1 Tax=Desmophyllum pertusum TaxID=174260 RepID=A0A9X0A5K3_9CNID|nr:hypothetical protein OS493_003528 [Desmophyllum pertusum]
MLVFVLLSLLAVSLAQDCDFENGQCGWKAKRMKWIRRQGDTPSGKGSYLSMNRGRVADLYNTFAGDTCLTLWYNINGAKSIEVVVDKDRVVKVLKSTDTKWHMAQVEITGVKQRIKLKGVRANKRQHIAIDDISFTDSCGPSPPTDRPTPPPPNPGTAPPQGPCGLKGNARITWSTQKKRRETRFYLHGATSWGNGCAAKNAYGVYARVSYFVDWVLMKIGKPGKPTTAAPTPMPGTPTVPGPNPPQGACGKGPATRIVGGVAAKHGDWPCKRCYKVHGVEISSVVEL